MIQKKLAKSFSILCISLFILLSLPIISVADDEKDGKMQLKMERIEQEQNEKMDPTETELEKVFPILFTDETNETVMQKDLEHEKTMGQLEESIFSIDNEKNSTVQTVQDTLFSEDYSVADSTKSPTEEESSSKSGLSKRLTAIFTGISILLSGGIYFAMRSWLD